LQVVLLAGRAAVSLAPCIVTAGFLISFHSAWLLTPTGQPPATFTKSVPFDRCASDSPPRHHRVTVWLEFP